MFAFLLPFTVGWSVSGSDWPALVYSFGPGYGQWQWPSGLRSRVRIEVPPTENDSTRLYKNSDISVVITCS